MLKKPILAIETSGKLCSAAVFFSENEYFEFNSCRKYSHSEKLFEIIDHLFSTAGIKSNDLSCVAVSSGPGSFTGLRIGLSAAKGIAFGASLPICAVPTFEALALQVIDYLEDGQEFVIANKANIDELYYAKFQITGNNYIFVEPLELIRSSELKSKVEGRLLLGDSDLSNTKISVPNSLNVARWYIKYGSDTLTSDYDYLEPNYLKNFIVKERKK